MSTQVMEKKQDTPVEWFKAKRKVFGKNLKAWIDKQPPFVEVGIATAGGTVQGGVLGGVMGSLSKINPPPAPTGAPTPQMQAMMGGPTLQARNFAVMTGVHALISSTLKKVRGVEDVKGNMAASFGSGAAFSLVTTLGTPNPLPNALSTGVVFALFQGAFYQLGQQFGGKKTDKDSAAYFRTDQMLDNLGLDKYKRNFRRGMLADTTIPLLTDSALHEVKIPAGPRLLILDHVGTYRDAYKHDLSVRAQQSMQEPSTSP